MKTRRKAAFAVGVACAAAGCATPEQPFAASTAPTVNPRVITGPSVAASELGVGEPAVRQDSMMPIGFGPTVRTPPTGFERCFSTRYASESIAVSMTFDVTAEGEPVNVVVAATQDACYDRAAQRAVASWRYVPAVVDGQPVAVRGVRTNIRFDR